MLQALKAGTFFVILQKQARQNGEKQQHREEHDAAAMRAY